MAQSLVQLNAPPDKRGHVIGLRKPPLSSELTLALGGVMPEAKSA